MEAAIEVTKAQVEAAEQVRALGGDVVALSGHHAFVSVLAAIELSALDAGRQTFGARWPTMTPEYGERQNLKSLLGRVASLLDTSPRPDAFGILGPREQLDLLLRGESIDAAIAAKAGK
jgi:hypothetical protein